MATKQTSKTKQTVKKIEKLDKEPATTAKAVEVSPLDVMKEELKSLDSKLAEVDKAEQTLQAQMRNMNDRKQQLYGAKFNLQALIQKMSK